MTKIYLTKAGSHVRDLHTYIANEVLMCATSPINMGRRYTTDNTIDLNITKCDFKEWSKDQKQAFDEYFRVFYKYLENGEKLRQASILAIGEIQESRTKDKKKAEV